MSLKDWKNQSWDDIGLFRHKNREEVIIITKSIYGKYYILTISSRKSSKHFKTKLQAFKFARAYMRRN